jgi:hypothetical protein
MLIYFSPPNICMPYPSEHAARIADPDQFTGIKRKNGEFGPGIDVIYGIKNDKSEVQAIRFDSSKYSPEQAKAWLKKHDYKPIRFEPATDSRENSAPDAPHSTGGSDPQPTGSIPHIRALQVAFHTANNLYDLENGDLLIKDVPLVAEGEWTDSAQKSPLVYTAKTLEAYAGNWIRRTGYNRHMGGVPRDESNRVSEAINPHFGQFMDEEGTTRAAVISDLLVYGSTPSGRAMQELIKRKIIKFVSVEHGGDEVENPQTHRMEAASLVFGGFAFVNKGACKVCRINEAAPAQETPMLKKDDSLEGLQVIIQSALNDKFKSPSPDGYLSGLYIVMTFPDRVIYSYDGKKFEVPYMVENDSATLGTPVEVEEVYVQKKVLEFFPGADVKELMEAIQKKQDKNMTAGKELEAAVAAATAPIMKEMEAIKAAQKPAEVKVEIPKELSELPGMVKELAGLPASIKALADRIDALEKDGIPKTDAGNTKELEALPEYYVPVDRKKGIVGAQ